MPSVSCPVKCSVTADCCVIISCRASIHVIRNRLRCIGSQRLFSTESTVNDTKSETTDTTAEAQVDDQVTQLNEQLEKLKADNEALSSSSRDFEVRDLCYVETLEI